MKRIAFFTAALAVALPVSAQNWATNNPVSGVAPSTARTNFGLAYNSLMARTVLYGGRSTSLGDQETWTFNGSSWTKMTPLNTPPALWGHSMVAAPQLGGVLLFGGRVGTTAQNQTWLWNGSNWAQIKTAHTPPARAFSQMAFDTRRGVAVLQGGAYMIPVAASKTTWEFDGKDWTEIVTSVVPPLSGDGRMDFDASRGVCVLFGGWDGSAGAYTGTWEYDGQDWRQIKTANSPSGRQWLMMSYDSHRARVVLQGGFGSGAANGTWEYDGTDWRVQSPAAMPTDAPDGQMCYDSGRKVHIYFGGRGPAGANVDTWEFTGGDLTSSYAWAGSGCGATGPMPSLAAAAGSTVKAGTQFTSEVSNLSATVASVYMIFGFTNASVGALPLDLGIVGMPNCYLHCTSDIAIPVPVIGGTASFSLPLPMSAMGGIYWNQAFVIDTGAGNALGAVMSNAMRAYIGN